MLVSTICIHITPPFQTSLPLLPSTPAPPPRSSQSTKLSSLCYPALSHALSKHTVVSIYVNLISQFTLPHFLQSASTYPFATSVCISVLQTCSSVIFFWIPHICISIVHYSQFGAHQWYMTLLHSCLITQVFSPCNVYVILSLSLPHPIFSPYVILPQKCPI